MYNMKLPGSPHTCRRLHTLDVSVRWYRPQGDISIAPQHHGCLSRLSADSSAIYSAICSSAVFCDLSLYAGDTVVYQYADVTQLTNAVHETTSGLSIVSSHLAD